MRNKLIAVGFAAALAISVASPFAGHARASAPAMPVASATHVHSAFLDKTRFLLHMGVAFYAFHHWVWNRYRQGTLNLHHKANLLKAGIALLFAWHEARVAYDIAQKSHSGTLHMLVAPLNALNNSLHDIGTRLKGGRYSSSDLSGLNSSVNSFGSMASGNGYGIKDVSVPIAGAA